MPVQDKITTPVTMQSFSMLRLVDDCVSEFLKSNYAFTDIKVDFSPDVPRYLLGDRARLNEQIASLLKQVVIPEHKVIVSLLVDMEAERRIHFRVRLLDISNPSALASIYTEHRHPSRVTLRFEGTDSEDASFKIDLFSLQNKASRAA